MAAGRMGRGIARGFVSVAAAWALGCASPAPAPVRPLARPRAVVLVTIDTLRADALGFAGRSGRVSPFLDALASEGVVFRHALAPSSFTPVSMASLMTGAWPRAHGVTWGELEDSTSAARQPRVAGDLPTLAEVFDAQGFATVGVPSNRHLMADLGFARGFDAYLEEAPFLPADEVVNQAARLLAQALGDGWRGAWRTRPTFLWIHLVDPHAPYEPWRPHTAETDPAALAGLDEDARLVADRGGQWDAAMEVPLDRLYDGEVRRADDALARLFRMLALDDDVLTLLTSDHGEALGERRALGHANTLYEEVIRVPLMVHWPAGLPGGRQVDTPVSLIDVAPTLLDLCGLPPLPLADGISLAPSMRGDPALAIPRRTLFAELHAPLPELRLVREGDLTLILTDDQLEGAELYDLAADRLQLVNLAPYRPEEVARLKEVGDAWHDGLTPPAEAVVVSQASPAVIEDLRAAGYVE